jgi:hypothetical protein
MLDSPEEFLWVMEAVTEGLVPRARDGVAVAVVLAATQEMVAMQILFLELMAQVVVAVVVLATPTRTVTITSVKVVLEAVLEF